MCNFKAAGVHVGAENLERRVCRARSCKLKEEGETGVAHFIKDICSQGESKVNQMRPKEGCSRPHATRKWDG